MKTRHSQCCAECSSHSTLCRMVNRFNVIMDMLEADFYNNETKVIACLKDILAIYRRKITKKRFCLTLSTDFNLVLIRVYVLSTIILVLAFKLPYGLPKYGTKWITFYF